MASMWGWFRVKVELLPSEWPQSYSGSDCLVGMMLFHLFFFLPLKGANDCSLQEKWSAFFSWWIFFFLQSLSLSLADNRVPCPSPPFLLHVGGASKVRDGWKRPGKKMGIPSPIWAEGRERIWQSSSSSSSLLEPVKQNLDFCARKKYLDFCDDYDEN